MAPMTQRERHLMQAAEAACSSWEAFRDDMHRDANALRHEDGLVCAFELLDEALNPYHLAYHLPSDGGE
jgi:hypothetical protein